MIIEMTKEREDILTHDIVCRDNLNMKTFIKEWDYRANILTHGHKVLTVVQICIACNLK